MSWSVNVLSIYAIYNKEQELLKIARRFGFRDIKFSYHPEGIQIFQKLGDGWIL